MSEKPLYKYSFNFRCEKLIQRLSLLCSGEDVRRYVVGPPGPPGSPGISSSTFNTQEVANYAMRMMNGMPLNWIFWQSCNILNSAGRVTFVTLFLEQGIIGRAGPPGPPGPPGQPGATYSDITALIQSMWFCLKCPFIYLFLMLFIVL